MKLKKNVWFSKPFGRYRDPQIQVDKNNSYLFETKHLQILMLKHHFIPGNNSL